jgi:hypothetical protein
MSLADFVTAVRDLLLDIVGGSLGIYIAAGIVVALAAWAFRRFVRMGR